jgi:hypothetical protein
VSRLVGDWAYFVHPSHPAAKVADLFAVDAKPTGSVFSAPLRFLHCRAVSAHCLLSGWTAKHQALGGNAA